jgi:hypothetical protein
MEHTSSIFTVIDSVEKSAKNSGNKEQLELAMETKNFVKTTSIIKRKNWDVIRNFWNKPDTLIAERTGIKESNIRGIKKQVSDQIIALLGKDFISNMVVGSPEGVKDCKYRLSVLQENKKVSNFFPYEFVDAVQNASVEIDFETRDCKAELDFLKRFSLPSFTKQLQELDPDKVAYLLRVLDRQAGTYEETFRFIKALESI